MPDTRDSTHPPELRDASDFADEIVAEIQQDAASPLVKLEERLPDGRVAVLFTDRNSPGFSYDFYCSGASDALQWIAHMAPKTWVTKRHLEIFAHLMLTEFCGGRR